MYFNEKAQLAMAVREYDVVESRCFLIGLGNGIWMSAVLAVALYWFLQVVL
jgi:hypothetical protein